jgi:hypothetical protein
MLSLLIPLPDGDVKRSRVVQAAAGVAGGDFASAIATSTYADNAGCYGPTFAVDQYSDYSSCKFFHSKATGGYPYLAATLAAEKSITSVTLKSRCDANGWGHTQFTLAIRAGKAVPAAVLAVANTGTSLLTQNTECGSFTGTVAQCSTVKIDCAAAIPSTVVTVQLYTNGQNVHLMFEELSISTAVSATATSSSVYFARYGDFSAYWGPAFAVDSAQSALSYNFFHSAHEPFPWIKITLPGAPTSTTTVTTVTLRSRCDANAWSCSVPNNINVEVRYGQVDIAAGKKGQLTDNTLCGRKIGCDASACQTFTITCAGGAVAQHYITVQMLDATNTFLMLDEVSWA